MAAARPRSRTSAGTTAPPGRAGAGTTRSPTSTTPANQRSSCPPASSRARSTAGPSCRSWRWRTTPLVSNPYILAQRGRRRRHRRATRRCTSSRTGKDGRYADLAPQLGLAVPIPTRGIATGDADGDGRLDFAVARQWGEPVYYHNDAPNPGGYLRPGADPRPGRRRPAPPAPAVAPAVGAEVTVTTADGKKYIDRVDGGSGHGGKRSSEVHIGLGDVQGDVQVHLQWRDSSGTVRQQDLELSQGRHAFVLGGPRRGEVRRAVYAAAKKKPADAGDARRRRTAGRPSGTPRRSSRRCAGSRSRSRSSTSWVTRSSGFEQPWTWPIVALATGYSVEIVLERSAPGSRAGHPAIAGGGGKRASWSSCSRRTSPRWP